MHQATASPIALEALQQMAALFALESEIRGQPPDRRAAARQEHARPLLDGLRAFLDRSLTRISDKSALAQAIRYSLSRWTALSRYVADGRLEMSNNAAERSIRWLWAERTTCSAARTLAANAPPASTPSLRPPR